MTKCESYLFSLRAAGNSSDYLANDMLSLLITLKIFILNHNSDVVGETSGGTATTSGDAAAAALAALDIDIDDDSTKKYGSASASSCFGGGGGKSNREVLQKLNRIDQKRLANFHFINTLENLKMHLVKYRTSSAAIATTINKHNNTNSNNANNLRFNSSFVTQQDEIVKINIF